MSTLTPAKISQNYENIIENLKPEFQKAIDEKDLLKADFIRNQILDIYPALIDSLMENDISSGQKLLSLCDEINSGVNVDGGRL